MTHEGRVVLFLTLYVTLCAIEALVIQYSPAGIASYIAIGALALAIVGVALYLNALPRGSGKQLAFRCPWLPWLPLVSVAINVYLLMSLSHWTWVRFAVWCALGKHYSSRCYVDCCATLPSLLRVMSAPCSQFSPRIPLICPRVSGQPGVAIYVGYSFRHSHARLDHRARVPSDEQPVADGAASSEGSRYQASASLNSPDAIMPLQTPVPTSVSPIDDITGLIG